MSHVAMTICYFCGEPAGIALHTQLKDISALDHKVHSMDPCDKCRKVMDLGVFIIVIDPDKSDPDWNKQRIPNPYRTGEMMAVNDDMWLDLCRHLRKSVKPEALATHDRIRDDAMKVRFTFMDKAIYERLGLNEMLEQHREDNPPNESGVSVSPQFKAALNKPNRERN
jgi:hypothetical protein